MKNGRAKTFGSKLRAAATLAISCAFTAALFWWLARHTTAQDWIALYHGLDRQMLLAYVGLFGLAVLLRAWRYRLLLGASSGGAAPGLWPLGLITLVSNLFVDLLPARSGSLAYIVFLNRKLRVALPACVSSFAYAFIFDILGMLPLFGLAIWLHGRQTGQAGWELYGLLAALGLLAVLAVVLLERGLGWAGALSAWLGRRLGGRPGRLLVKAAAQASAMAHDVARVRRAGVLGRLLLVSVGVRFCKYLGLYLLMIGIAGHFGPAVLAALSFPLVLFALLVSEATASLPVSGIAGFGAYEGVMAATLLAVGLDQTQAAMIPFGLHLTTQLIDYSLGGLALITLGAGAKKDDEKT